MSSAKMVAICPGQDKLKEPQKIRANSDSRLVYNPNHPQGQPAINTDQFWYHGCSWWINGVIFPLSYITWESFFPGEIIVQYFVWKFMIK